MEPELLRGDRECRSLGLRLAAAFPVRVLAPPDHLGVSGASAAPPAGAAAHAAGLGSAGLGVGL
eukprot:8039573-Lingulodinium_polyedra.AAC.1